MTEAPLVTLTGVEKTYHAGRVAHAPNAKGNFCFEVTLGYRRVERGR